MLEKSNGNTELPQLRRILRTSGVTGSGHSAASLLGLDLGSDWATSTGVPTSIESSYRTNSSPFTYCLTGD